MNEIDTEALISALMLYVSSKTTGFPTAKRLATERYMRTFLRSLTKIEVQLAAEHCKVTGSLEPDLAFKLDQASRGYDRYMSRRGKVRV